MKTITTLVLHRKDLCSIHQNKNKKEVTLSNFKSNTRCLIDKAEAVIFEGILLTSRY